MGLIHDSKVDALYYEKFLFKNSKNHLILKIWNYFVQFAHLVEKGTKTQSRYVIFFKVSKQPHKTISMELISYKCFHYVLVVNEGIAWKFWFSPLTRYYCDHLRLQASLHLFYFTLTHLLTHVYYLHRFSNFKIQVAFSSINKF